VHPSAFSHSFASMHYLSVISGKCKKHRENEAGEVELKVEN